MSHPEYLLVRPGDGRRETDQVRNSNEHKFVARPDMEMLRRDGKSRFRVLCIMVFWGDCKLAPQRVDVLLLIIHPGVFHHMIPCCGMSSISPYKKIKVDFDFLVSRTGDSIYWFPNDFEPGLPPLDISASELVVEVELHVGHGFKFVQEDLVETSTVSCIICLRLN